VGAAEWIEEERVQKSGSVHHGKEGPTPGWGSVGGKGKAGLKRCCEGKMIRFGD